MRAAVHRDWVKEGLWTIDLGADFDSIWEMRDLGEYGGGRHVDAEDAAAIEAARRILRAVLSQHPQLDPRHVGLDRDC